MKVTISVEIRGVPQHDVFRTVAAIMLPEQLDRFDKDQRVTNFSIEWDKE